jgi:hypothetical protein
VSGSNVKERGTFIEKKRSVRSGGNIYLCNSFVSDTQWVVLRYIPRQPSGSVHAVSYLFVAMVGFVFEHLSYILFSEDFSLVILHPAEALVQS